jgi:FkbM family methyltransferase
MNEKIFSELVNKEKIFYSQCQEDIFLYENYFKNKRNGVYIELGALDGNLYSNTKFFEDYLNWKGILIEPNLYQFQSLKENRPNNFLFNNLISNSKEELKFRYFLKGHAAVSGVEDTLSQHHMDEYFDRYNENNYLPQNSIYMKPKTLTEIVKSTYFNHIDFLSLDVEGHEYEVLQSWDFSIPIYLILIEMLGVQPEKDELCRQILIKNGYKFDKKCSHNEIYILDK